MRIKIEDLPPRYRKQAEEQLKTKTVAVIKKDTADRIANIIKTGFLMPKKLKYKNKPCEWNGIKFRSQKERDYAIKLENMKKSREINEWFYEDVLQLCVDGKNLCKIIPDFLVFIKDKREYHEIKQKFTKTPVWRLKWKLAQMLYPDYVFKVIDK